MKKELNEVKNKLVYSNNERHLLQSKIEFQMQKIKKKEVEYKQFKGRIKSDSGIDTDDSRSVQLLLQQLTKQLKADLKIGEPSMESGTKLLPYNSEHISRIFGFRSDQRYGINKIVMGPHRKNRKKLEEYFEEVDKPKSHEISSALQSNSLNSKKKFQFSSENRSASTFYDGYCEISVSRTQALDETFERQTPDSDNKSKVSIHVSNLHPDVTEEMLLEKSSSVGPVQSIQVFGSSYVACINFEQQYHGKTYVHIFFSFKRFNFVVLESLFSKLSTNWSIYIFPNAIYFFYSHKSF